MKITLVFPPFFLDTMYNLPPLGLINLATALKNTGHEVTVQDFVLAIRKGTLTKGKAIYNHCAEKILSQKPEIVGFSAQCTTYPAVIQIAREIKHAAPEAIVVVGGHNPSFVDRETLEKFPCIDVIVRGEGEITFPELVNAFSQGKDLNDIGGITFRKNGKIVRNPDRKLIPDLNSLPLPDYSFVPPISVYRDACGLPRSIAILEVGRGCPHRCVYCSESILWRRTTRTLSVTRIVEEMNNLHINFGAECFLLAYDQFTARRRFVEAFCREVIEKGLNHLPWYCISRIDTVDSSLLALMKDAGCESMCYGIDSGSKRTLAFINKNIDQNILYKRVVETAEQGIIPTLSFVIGFPEEDRHDIDETLMLALRAGIIGNNNPLIQMPTVLPGTCLHKAYIDSVVREVDTYFALGLEFDHGQRLASDETLINSDPRIFSSFYNIPCKGMPLEELHLLATYFPIIVQLYPKTFLLLSIDYGISVSDLFLSFLDYVKEKENMHEHGLTAQQCYKNFVKFVSHMARQQGTPTRPYFSDIMTYEECANAVAKFNFKKTNFDIDLNRLQEFRPIANPKIILQEFDFDIPLIILDLKAGKFFESYPQKKTFLAFKQEGDNLEVSEINSFVKDFLSLCTGELTLKEISNKLFPTYGNKNKREDFFLSCTEAAKILGNEGLIEATGLDTPEERR